MTEFWIYPVPQLSKIDRKGANVKEGTKDAHRKRVTKAKFYVFYLINYIVIFVGRTD